MSTDFQVEGTNANASFTLKLGGFKNQLQHPFEFFLIKHFSLCHV